MNSLKKGTSSVAIPSNERYDYLGNYFSTYPKDMTMYDFGHQNLWDFNPNATDKRMMQLITEYMDYREYQIYKNIQQMLYVNATSIENVTNDLAQNVQDWICQDYSQTLEKWIEEEFVPSFIEKLVEEGFVKEDKKEELQQNYGNLFR